MVKTPRMKASSSLTIFDKDPILSLHNLVQGVLAMASIPVRHAGTRPEPVLRVLAVSITGGPFLGCPHNESILGLLTFGTSHFGTFTHLVFALQALLLRHQGCTRTKTDTTRERGGERSEAAKT